MITSKDNSRVKLVKKLLSKSKYRREEKAFILEGFKPVNEAVRLGLVRDIYFSEAVCEEAHLYHKKYSLLLDYLNKNSDAISPNVDVISNVLFEEISDMVTGQGVFALVEFPTYDTSALFDEENCKLLCLEEVRDPGNIGTMIRTAEAAGFDAIVLSPGCADVYQPKVVRSTAGAILRMPCMLCEKADFIGKLKELKEKGFKLYATHLQGAVDYREPSYEGRVGVIIGNEANGLSDEATAQADVRVKIPMHGEVESLNAAVAAALLMYEADR